MGEKTTSRVTQIMDRGELQPQSAGDSVSSIVRFIEHGEEPRRIFSAVVECACNTPGVKAAAMFLPSDRSNDQQELVASFGPFQIEEGRTQEIASRISVQSAASHLHKSSSGDYHYFDVICLGAPIGSLVIVAPNGISSVGSEKLNALAHHTGVVFERQKLSNTLQHFLDRLQVLNELNQLIASNVGLQRILKSLARESAFRFDASIK